jgi:hypothetical protein
MAWFLHPTDLTSSNTSAHRWHALPRLRLGVLDVTLVQGPFCNTTFFEGSFCNMAA